MMVKLFLAIGAWGAALSATGSLKTSVELYNKGRLNQKNHSNFSVSITTNNNGLAIIFNF